MSWNKILEKLVTAAIPMIIETVGNFLKKFTTAPQLKETSSVEDIEKIASLISALREHVFKSSEKTILSANSYVIDYIDEQLFDLNKNAELFARYEISTELIQSQLKKIKNQLEDFWKDSIYKKISLDNAMCRNLLKMSPDENKEIATEKFAESVLESSLNEYVAKISEMLENLYVDLEKDITKTIAQLEKTVQEYSALINALEDDNEKKYETLLADAEGKVFCCKMILKKLEG